MKNTMDRTIYLFLKICVICIHLLMGLNVSAWSQNEVLIFSVIGDVPYDQSEEAVLQQQIIEHNLYSPSEFMVHVGDIQKESLDCPESVYSKVAGFLSDLKVPTFIIPGDNEWTDCGDPDQAWSFWTEHFMDFEQNFCGAPLVERQAVRPENFAWVTKGVLLIGLNMPGESNAHTGSHEQRLQDNADWVKQQFADKGDQVQAAVVFGHSLSEEDSLFEDQLLIEVDNLGLPVIYVMGEEHEFSFTNPYKVDNLSKLVVDQGANALPLQVTVTLDPIDPFLIEQTPWSSDSSPFNMPPCVEAGPDQVISHGQTLSFDGRAEDDGVPTSPGDLELNWIKVSGPGEVTFADPTSATTTASFSTGGNYVLSLTATDGELTGSDEMVVTVTAPPTITSFSPTSGLVGSEVTIIGENFIGATAVSFNGTSAVFVVDSAGQIRTTVPNGATTGPLSVMNDTGAASSSTDFTVTTSSSPTISSFSPTSGPVGTEVTVVGSNFTEVSLVSFNGVLSSFSIDSDSQLRATVPVGATTGPIDLIGPHGTGMSGSVFSVTVPSPPTITAFSPISGLVGSEVTIVGEKFTGATSVLFNGTSAAFTVVSSTEIHTTVPVDATTGLISVTNSEGTGTSSSDFTVTSPPSLPPTIVSFTPTSGPVGTEVTISGSNFTETTDVAFNGTSAPSFTVDSDSQLR
ncbi:hypothetical protein GWO43_27935, partial [candidate division KSB1 bacterium]|nr:hypothetical protein [candidate division KSB1 bacterium]NIV69418.1 hypothetical protein [Phycisphaerae bacterium]NIR70716.1 hypothetical protein [candidate division KSB1 bacterium]NIS27773.1 hypothetical protein [candidate division KSB1 bacterium]NIT74621.1 hypothetical protein [candidate division KSB1 bacterium]